MYLLKVVSGSHHIKKKKFHKGQTFKSHLPLHLTFKNKFECLNEDDEEDEIEEPIFLDSTDDDDNTDVPDNSSDDADKDDDEEAEEEEEEVEDEEDEDDGDDFITLPLKLDQVSERRFNVVDAKGVQVNEKKLTKKQAEALIEEYEEGE